MNRTDTVKMMAILKAAYPQYYKDTGKDELDVAVNLWCEIFADVDAALVRTAVIRVILNNKFPPTIADIVGKIRELTTKQEMSEMEAWGYIKKALKSSYYCAKEEWEFLPEEVRCIVSPDLLRTWCTVDIGDLETVIQSNFIRSYKSKAKVREELKALSTGDTTPRIALADRFKELGE